MAFKDLREWIDKLESEGELKRIKAKVDWNLELAQIARRAVMDRGPALLFENIKGYEKTRCTRLFTSGLTRRSRLCWMLGLPKDATREETLQVTKKRFKESVKPIVVKTGPVKENIVKLDDIDLFQFPVPKWHPLDGGRYINTFHGCVTRDPDTGRINLGIYRGMIVDRRRIGVYLIPHQHWGQDYLKYQKQGKAMPVAVVYGWDPAMVFVAGSPLSHPPSEYEVLGAIRQAPVELVKCETSDLLVPASAEIVIEGTVSPDPATYEVEGPFAEWTGYYGTAGKRPVIEVQCITHRNDPIFRGQPEGMMRPGVISEAGYMAMTSLSAVMWNYLETAGVPGILGITSGPTIAVKIHKTYEGQARQVGMALFGAQVAHEFVKNVIVVDDDVDIYNARALELALRDRVDPECDLLVIPGASGSPLDPSIAYEERDELTYGTAIQSKLLIDATINWRKHPIRPEWGNRRYPPLCKEMLPEIEELVQKRWKEYGF